MWLGCKAMQMQLAQFLMLGLAAQVTLNVAQKLALHA
jgi:hypothetical protein